MSLLLALCGNKDDLSVKEVPLSDSAQDAVGAAFSRQEPAFRDGEEMPFDENWLNEGDQIATAPIPDDVSIFGDILHSTDTSLAPVKTDHLQEIRGLAIKTNNGSRERILVQSFVTSQSLSRPMLVSLLFERGTYTRLETSAFRLDEKLVCIVEDGHVKVPQPPQSWKSNRYIGDFHRRDGRRGQFIREHLLKPIRDRQRQRFRGRNEPKRTEVHDITREKQGATESHGTDVAGSFGRYESCD